ncbi:MAG: DUF4404 family protein [Planctomycetaceae bacterium]
MNADELQTALQALHEELSSTREVDDSTREMLSRVTEDIQRLLSGEGERSSEAATYSSRLRDMVFEFEANHPKIGNLLERLSDGLANLGI